MVFHTSLRVGLVLKFCQPTWENILSLLAFNDFILIILYLIFLGTVLVPRTY